jgi:hypothetical protein
MFGNDVPYPEMGENDIILPDVNEKECYTCTDVFASQNSFPCIFVTSPCHEEGWRKGINVTLQSFME